MQTSPYRMDIALTTCLILFLTIFHQGHGKGIVTVRFLKYINPNGLGSNGQCCDGRLGMCFSQCDHMFTVCLDTVQSGDGVTSCEYGDVQTGAVENHNTITFGSLIRDTANPIIFDIPGAVPRELDLKVDVWDKDKVFGVARDHDHVELLRQRVAPSQQAVLNAQPTKYTLGQRTSLSVEITVRCAENYYSAACDVQCIPPRQGQHYVCDRNTGKIICDQGWMGELCSVEEETCEPGHCANGGTCTVVKGMATCQCPQPFQGLLCDAHACDAGCAPGWCIWWSGGYMCQCPPGYEGVFNPSGMTCEVATTTTTVSTTTTTSTATTPRPTTPTSPISTTTMAFPDRDNADCDRLADNGFRYLDGVYTIHAGQKSPFQVYCDMTHDGAGWTVIQRRRDGGSAGQLNFNRTWEDYKNGFGEPGLREHWLGLENIYHLTNQRRYRLLIKMQVGDGTWRYAGYGHFWIENEANQYRLHVNEFSGGNAGDALYNHEGRAFTTRDRDNDDWAEDNCAKRYAGGWWFDACGGSNLNGVYLDGTRGWPRCPLLRSCISWKTIPDFGIYSLLIVEMKILPNPRF